MLLCIVYGILFVDTVDTKIKARNALNAMFVKTVDTLVFVTLTQHLIQSTMRCENSTLLYIKWPLTLIFNQFSIRKKFWKAETEGFSTIPSILYVNTVNTGQGSLMHSMLSMSTLSIQNTSTQFYP